MIRVAFLIEQFDPRRGGMEQSAAEFLVELRALGWPATVVTHASSAAASFPDVAVVGRARAGRAARYHDFVVAADRYVSARKFAVVHAITPCCRCDLYQPRSGIVPEALARTIALRRNALTRWLRGIGAKLDSKQRLLARLERGLFRQHPPVWVAALSRYLERQVREVYGADDSRIRYVFNGVTVPAADDSERRSARERCRAELKLNAGKSLAIFVGHNFRRKGLMTVLRALADAKLRERWCLAVLGKDDPRRFRAAAAGLGIAERVHFLGSRRDVRDWYLAADASVLPTYYDPCARSTLESVSLGVPPITTVFDGASDCLENGVTGFVLSSAEASPELVSALLQLELESFQAAMRRRCLELRPRVSMRRHAQEIAEVYEEIAQRGKELMVDG